MPSKFVRTEKTPKKEIRGQAALVLTALDNANGVAKTIDEITADIGDVMVTRQEPSRVTAYYITMFKKQGLVVTAPDVKVAAETKTDEDEDQVPADETADDLPTGEDEDGDDEDEDGDDDN